MKIKYNLTLILLAVIATVNAQDAIDKYFGQFAENPDFTSVIISSKMFELFAKMEPGDPDNEELKDAIKGLKGIRILALDERANTTAKGTDYKSAIQKVGKEYEVLMSIDDKDEKVRFYILEEGDLIKELFMVVGGKDNLVLMSLVGNIDLEKMSSLSKKMNVGGMNYLENLNENNKTK